MKSDDIFWIILLSVILGYVCIQDGIKVYKDLELAKLNCPKEAK